MNVRAYSILFVKSFFLAFLPLAGCSMHGDEALLKEHARSQQITTEMQSRFVEARHPFIDQYFETLRARLTSRAELRNGPTIVFLTREKFAFSPGAGVVLISSGLIKSLKNEAELAFVISHELGHTALGHHSLSDEEVADKRIELEEKADSYGLGAMALSGYDPNAAIMALHNSYQSLRTPEAPSTHPSLESRMSKMQREIIDSGWRPPGTVHKRDFIKLQGML